MSVRLSLYLGGLTIVGACLFACGTTPAQNEPVATPDLIATEVAVKKAAAATLTAEAMLAQAQVTEESPATEDPTPTETPAAETPLPSPTLSQPAGDTVAVPDTATPIPPECTVVANGLNVRSGPSVVYEPALGTLAQGVVVIPQTRIADNTWVQIQAAETGQVGWVSAGAPYISCNIDLASLPLGQVPPTPTPLPTATSIPPTPTPTPPLLVDVPVEGGQSELEGKIIIPGFTRDQLKGSNNDITFRDRLVFRVEVYDPGKGKHDGAGIKEVNIRIFGPNSHEPDNPNHERIERTAGYCVFGGGEPDCNVFNLKDNHRWPETDHDIVNGYHAVRIVITTEDDRQETWNWSFEIDR